MDRGHAVPTEPEPQEAVADEDERLVAVWQESRSGARAGRGFHFQDAVGAWLAVRIAGGDVPAEALVAEGLEDLSIEGSADLQIQVKSRVEHLGPFPLGRAARHITDAWNRHIRRGSTEESLTVVLERGIKDLPLRTELDRSLDSDPVENEPLVDALARVGQAEGFDDGELAKLVGNTAVVGITWDQLTRETVEGLGELYDCPPSGLRFVARGLRTIVADTADANAALPHADRSRLRRTDITAAIERLVEQVDVAALESALSDGVCEPLELPVGAPPDDRFYEGTATQPAHVAAGLVVPRPELVAEALAGLDAREAVVLTGPSGVGKSAVLWTIPTALPGVLWYRVRRLADKDCASLVRLARAYGVSPESPVGFLIDSAGTGDFRGWARLRAEASAIPGMFIVSTARREDLPLLGNLSDCATVGVRLDKRAAERIYEGLVRRGATQAPHWMEAYQQADGLTLEFTHLLTSGRRLSAVIEDQVRRRIDEGRSLELELLSLVSVADRWSSSISISEIEGGLSGDRVDLRKAIGRLVEEHLLVEHQGTVTGLHRLRSATISEAIHSVPPPTLAETVARVLELVSTDALHRFVAQMLQDEPTLAPVAIRIGSQHPTDLERLIGYLHGLRLADFQELALTWKEVAEDHGVPPSSQPVLFMFAAAGLTFPDIFPEPIRAAREAMGLAAGPNRREKLVAALGGAAVVDLLESTQDVAAATRLLASLEGCQASIEDAATSSLTSSPPLIVALESAPLDELANCLAAARAFSPSLSTALVEAIGGKDQMLDRIRSTDPWLTDLEVRTDEDKVIGFGRFLHVSDALQPEPRQRAIDIGRTLLRCLPDIDSVDVKALLPGGHEMRVGDMTHGTTGLQRQHDHSSLGLAWNQARLRTALTLIGESDTNRLSQAEPLLNEAASLMYAVSTTFVAGVSSAEDLAALNERIAELHEGGRCLKPSLGLVEHGDTSMSEEAPAGMNDDLSSLITDLTGNVIPRLATGENYRSLASYLAETVIDKHLAGVAAEPWHLLGYEGHPDSVDRLHAALLDLQAVVAEFGQSDADVARITRSARAGGRAGALRRAGESSRTAARRRRQAHRASLERACRETGLRAKVITRPADAGQLTSEALVTVELDSVIQWPEAVERLEAALGAIQPAGETYALVPLRHGRPVPSLAMKVITSTWPHPSLDEWADALEQPHPSPLATALDEAHAALQTISAICQFPEEQLEHEIVQAAVNEAVDRFRNAHQAVLALDSDPLIDELVGVLGTLADRVQDEADGATTGQSLAEEVVLGALQVEDSEVLATLLGARFLALEWDIDPGAAVVEFRALP